MKWIKKELQNDLVNSLSKELEIHEALIKVLLNRGLTQEQIAIVTNDISKAIIDPSLLKDAEAAAEVIYSYVIDPKAYIVIRADYDVDGITSGYILGQAIKDIAQCELDVSYPERHEGYGLKQAFCDLVVATKEKFELERVLLITVDNGVTAVDEVAFLQENGIEVIITDHHMPKETLPNCIVVDPHKDEEDTFNHLAGCGVAFKVAQLIQRLAGVSTMNNYLAPLAIGTIADMMPMSLENIAFALYGMDQMNSDSCPVGLQALKDYLGKKAFSFSDIGWEIGPRLNSCGRMGNIELASKLFFNQGLDYDTIMDDIVTEIDMLNIKRKEFTESKTQEAFALADETSNVIIVTLDDCPEGIAGVVANKVIEKYKRPAIVLIETDKGYVGSARSIDGLSIQALLKAEQEKGLIENFGGHEAAAGLTVNKKQLKALKESLKTVELEIELVSAEEQELFIDGQLVISDLNMNFLDVLNSLPYDNATFTSPIFELVVDVDIKESKPTAKNPDNMWLFIKDKTGTKKIWARDLTQKYASLENQNKVRIAGYLKTDFMNKHKTVTLEIIDIKEA